MHSSLAVTTEGLPLDLEPSNFGLSCKTLERKADPTRVPIERSSFVDWRTSGRPSRSQPNGIAACISPIEAGSGVGLPLVVPRTVDCDIAAGGVSVVTSHAAKPVFKAVGRGGA